LVVPGNSTAKSRGLSEPLGAVGSVLEGWSGNSEGDLEGERTEVPIKLIGRRFSMGRGVLFAKANREKENQGLHIIQTSDGVLGWQKPELRGYINMGEPSFDSEVKGG